MNIEQIQNTLREFQAENRQKFKNTQAEFKKAVSYIKKKCTQIIKLIDFMDILLNFIARLHV